MRCSVRISVEIWQKFLEINFEEISRLVEVARQKEWGKIVDYFLISDIGN